MAWERIEKGRKLEVTRALSGWKVWIDDKVSDLQFKTKRDAMWYAIGYAKRHPKEGC